MGLQHKAIKAIIINALSDLPTAAGGKYQLADNTTYLIGSPLSLGSNHLAMGNNTRLDSIGKDVTTVTYSGSGAAIRGTDVSCIVREIKVQGAAKGFEFTGTKTEGVSVLSCNFTACGEVGSFNELYFYKYAECVQIANLTGITITDCSYMLMQANNWFGNNGGTYVNIPTGDFVSIKIVDNNMEMNGTVVGVHIDDATITHTQQVVLALNQFEGISPNRITGFNPLDGTFETISNIGIPNVEKHENVTTAEMFAISNPRISMSLFNTDLNELVYWNGTNWVTMDGNGVYQEDYSEDFESGLGGWIQVDGGENDWERGTTAANGGAYGVYISNDGGTSHAYSSVGGGLDVSHFYKDILLPSATSEIVLQFDYRCEAEIGYDYGGVYDIPTSTTPVANTELVSGQVGSSEYNNQSTWKTEQILLPIGEAGTTRRICFSWRNDSSVENQPPMVIDNIKILYI